MSATEELRELLDERGVEYEGGERSLRWRDRYGVMMQAFPLANGELGMGVWSCTPEQAVAATLGSEREKELESLAADMFCWLVDYLTPQQVRTWENRLEDLDVPPTWGVRS